MGDEQSAEKRKSKRGRKPAMSPEAEARFSRRMSILLGLLPLPEMTQNETDWMFQQKVRLASE
jgi:hypothetical protein